MSEERKTVVVATIGKAQGAMWTGGFVLFDDGRCRAVWTYERERAATFDPGAGMDALKMALPPASFGPTDVQSRPVEKRIEDL